MTAPNNAFDEQTVLRELKRFLPAMSSSGAFTYQNPLQAFQDHSFHDALRYASRIMGYRTTLPLEEYRSFYNAKIVKPEILEKVLIEKKGGTSTFEWQDKVLMKKFPAEVPPRIGKLRENWKTQCKMALDEMVHPALFRMLGSYLDQSSAAWKFPVHGQGFFDSMREMESDSLFSVFKTSRARNLLLHTSPSLTDLLALVVGDEALFEQYLFDQQMAHRGWSGLVVETEEHNNGLPGERSISLHDVILFELLLEIDALDYHLNEHWNPLSTMLTERPDALFTPVPVTEKSEVLAIWQETFEWSYYDQVIAALCNQQGSSQFSEQLPEAMPGYTSNSVYIVGGRALIRSPFAGRREFLNPYDFSADTDGEILGKILETTIPVCGAMNLEYFFSRVGLAKAAAGDLETGLPPQIAKRHQPLRLLCVVEQLPEIVLKAVKQLNTAHTWFANEWVHLVVVHPISRELRVLKNGKMIAFKSDRRLAEVEVH